MKTKKFFQKRMGRAYKHYRLGYTVFAALGLALIAWFQLNVDSIALFPTSVLSSVLGAVVSVPGLVLMGICIKKYFLNLSGLRSLVQEEVYTELEVAGIHRHIRHPLYSGTFLFLWGLLLIFPTFSLLLSNSIITVYTLLAIGLEEDKLVAQFGESYRVYQKNGTKADPKIRGGRKAAGTSPPKRKRSPISGKTIEQRSLSLCSINLNQTVRYVIKSIRLTRKCSPPEHFYFV